MLGHFTDACMSGVLDVVDDGEEGVDIYACAAAGGFYCLVAEAELDAEATDDLQDAVVIADDIAHGVFLVVFFVHFLGRLFRVLCFFLCKGTLSSANRQSAVYNFIVKRGDFIIIGYRRKGPAEAKSFVLRIAGT